MCRMHIFFFKGRKSSSSGSPRGSAGRGSGQDGGSGAAAVGIDSV